MHLATYTSTIAASALYVWSHTQVIQQTLYEYLHNHVQ